MALLGILCAPALSAAQAPPFQYSARPPSEFTVGRRQPDGMIRLGNIAIRSPAADELAWYAAAGPTTDVVVSSFDLGDLAALRSNQARWRNAVIERYASDLVGGGPQGAPPFVELPLGPEDPAGGLTACVARRYGSDTGDLDLYIRFAERDGKLYRVVLRVMNSPSAARVRRWIAAFLDVPFAIPHSALRAFPPGRPYRRGRPPRNNE
jgi:hypothetical protein